MALGAALGLTPLVSLQNFVIFCLIFVLNVSFGAALLAWVLATPIGFLLDPLADRIGRALLESPALTPLWTTLAHRPLVPFTNFNNSVTLGSFVAWVILFVPMYFGFRHLVVRYRATLGQRIQQSHWYKALAASQLYNVYRWFVPE